MYWKVGGESCRVVGVKRVTDGLPGIAQWEHLRSCRETTLRGQNERPGEKQRPLGRQAATTITVLCAPRGDSVFALRTKETAPGFRQRVP